MDADMNAMIERLIQAAEAGNWTLLVGLAIMLLLAIAEKAKLLRWVPQGAMKWVAGGLALLGGIGTGLAADMGITTMLINSLGMAVSAIGGWELLLKPLLKKLGGDGSDAPAEPEA